MRNLYVMLACTTTSVSKMIRHAVKSEYTHSAISLDRELTEMYSFARRRPHNFLVSGFIHENLDKGVYSWNMDAPCVLYKFEVSEESYNTARAMIDQFMENYKKHTYNIIGLFAIKYNKELKRKYKYACSQFVAHVLIESGVIHDFKKSIWLTQPDDLIDLEGSEVVYKGPLRGVRDIEQETGNTSDEVVNN